MNFPLDEKQFNQEKYIKLLPLASITLFFLVLILAYFVLSPFYSLILKQEKEIQDKSKSLVKRQNEIRQLLKLKEEIPDFPSKIVLLEKIISSKKDPDQFLAQISKISKNSNLVLSSVTPEVSNDGLKASIELFGNYENFRLFLDSLENNLLIIDVTSISISGEGDNIRFSLKIKAAGI